ncbi:MAG: hypothetical protein ACXVW7_07230 [Trebonia sp.]
MVLDIRAGSAADAAEIRRVRRESWIAAYTGIVDRAAIDRATAEPPPDRPAPDPPPHVRTLVAIGGDDPAVIGFASFGPERAVVSASYPAVPQAGGPTALPGELYALYVTPPGGRRAGFVHDGVTNILTGLGGVLELRYARDL